MERQVYNFDYDHKSVVEMDRIGNRDCFAVLYYVGSKNISVVGEYTPTVSNHYVVDPTTKLGEWLSENWQELLEEVSNG